MAIQALSFPGMVMLSVAALGLAYILGYSRLTLPAREGLWKVGGSVSNNLLGGFLHLVVEVAECPACLGFWTGVAAGYVLHLPLTPALGLGLYVSGSNFLFSRATGLMVSPTQKQPPPPKESP